MQPSRARRARSSQTVLEVSNLHIRRSGIRILQDISWHIQQGEHWVMLGANGSGKTSLLSALAGYLTPTAGSITVLGRQYGRADWRTLRKEIGVVSSSIRQMMAEDEPALDTIVSGKYAMIALWGKARAADRRQALRVLRQIECAHLAERPWAVLSQGERQRILIGRALMARPRLLILDEPCAGLDPAAREHFLQFLQRLGRRRDSPALILVTHHVEEIMPVFSHVLVLKKGAVRAGGRKSGVLRTVVLADAFGAAMRLHKRNGRYSLSVARRAKTII